MNLKKIFDSNNTNALAFLSSRFDEEYEDDIKEFAENQWDNSKSDYENLKEFKIFIDDKYDNYSEGGDLFEVHNYYDSDAGTVTPLYIVNDIYGVDFDFAEQWVKDKLSDDGLELDRFWEEDGDHWEYITK